MCDDLSHVEDKGVLVAPPTPHSSPRLVTLFTDASMCPTTLLGAYALWAKADGITYRHSGVFRQPLPRPDSTRAEFQAMLNGLTMVATRIKPHWNGMVVAQTDSEGVVNMLNSPPGPGKLLPRNYTELFEQFALLRQRLTCRVSFRWVRGHQGNQNVRSAVNTWCDVEARRVLRQARDAR